MKATDNPPALRARTAWWRELLPERFFAHAARFCATGVASAAVQLAVLALLVDAGLHSWPGNAAAIAIAAQVNFTLSQWFTWRDRRASGNLGGRWLRFMCAISSTVAVNFGVFAAASLALSPLSAAACGIGVAAVANFVLADHFVFERPDRAGENARSRRGRAVPAEEH